MPTPLSNRRRIRKALTGIGCGAFTAIMLLQLTQSGMVHFSDPVAKYLPKTRSVHNSFPDAAPVTLLQLALHTSGLALDSRDAGIYTKGSASDWGKTLFAALAHTSYEFASGTHGALYGNGNVNALIVGAPGSAGTATPSRQYRSTASARAPVRFHRQRYDGFPDRRYASHLHFSVSGT